MWAPGIQRVIAQRSMQNAAAAAGKISLLGIRSGLLPADYWSNRYIAAGDFVVGPQKMHLCTNAGEIHKFTRFLHLHPQFDRT
jgi:hypothetical protein